VKLETEAIYKKALIKWGIDTQILMAAEELGELQHECFKILRGKGDKTDSLAEEIADVEIMLAQLKIIFDFKRKVARFKHQKLLNLQELLRET